MYIQNSRRILKFHEYRNPPHLFGKYMSSKETLLPCRQELLSHSWKLYRPLERDRWRAAWGDTIQTLPYISTKSKLERFTIVEECAHSYTTHVKVGGGTESFGRNHGDNICRVIYYMTDVTFCFRNHLHDEILPICEIQGSYIDKKMSTSFTSTRSASGKCVKIQLFGGTIPITRGWHICR